MIKPLNGVDNVKFQPIIRKLDNIQIAITPYPMTPLHKMTKQVLIHMQSYNEYSEIQKDQGSIILENRQILGKIGFEAEAEEDDMAKLERIFTKMVIEGKVNKN